MASISAGLAQEASGPQRSGPAGDGARGVSVADARAGKQKALALQVEQLFAMATELKAQVDKTNRNILSLKVVEKAEQIELMAKEMKGVSKR